MKLIIFEDLNAAADFYPISLSRPVFELRCGILNLAEKISRHLKVEPSAYLVRPYLVPTFRRRTKTAINDLSEIGSGPVLMVNGQVKSGGLSVATDGPSEIGMKGDRVVYCRLVGKDIAKIDAGKIGTETLPLVDGHNIPARQVSAHVKLYEYSWDVMLESPHEIAHDFQLLGRRGIEGTVEQPNAIRGSKDDVYVGTGARIHPMVVIDASNGPVYLSEDVEVHPFTRIEGPAFVGRKSLLLGAKLREGCSIGPVCRVGGEVEESVMHAYSNKYHDGFLGHAYVGEFVNLGALTTNSDLKNDYTDVEVILNGRKIDTHSTKVGSIIGDHTKTSIGTLFNTGSIVGAMAVIMATGQPLPKAIPSFAWFINGVVTKGFGHKKLYETAKTATGRRKVEWTPDDLDLWEKIYEITAPERDEAIRKGRKQMVRK
jgi:UDP-N-acetylglucosamine diphosphorylase/glucosamine-1-phosphate N-acetyltransferase